MKKYSDEDGMRRIFNNIINSLRDTLAASVPSTDLHGSSSAERGCRGADQAAVIREKLHQVPSQEPPAAPLPQTFLR